MAGPGYGDVDEDNHLFTRTLSVWRKQAGQPSSTMVGAWFEPAV